MGLRLLLSLLLLSFLYSCHSKDETKSSIKKDTDSNTELTLRQEMNAHPDSFELKQELISYYADSGQYRKALNVVDSALKTDSTNAELWSMKATLDFEDNDTIASIKSFEHAASIFPLPEYLIPLGTLYAQTRNPKALKVADAVSLSDKKTGEREAAFMKGLYYSYTGDKPKAISLFDTCIKKDYSYLYAYREKAIALYDMGKYNEAVEVLNKAVTISNSFDEGYYWLGRCYEKLGRLEDAKQNYHIALLYDKDFVEARDALNRIEKSH
jgi:Flp pilus assembly protein TadD